MRALSFTVNGPPVPKARARVMTGYSYTPPRTRAYEAIVRDHAIKAVSCSRDWKRDNENGYRVCVAVYREALRGDLDNFVKTATDAMNKGVVYDDDRRIVEIHAMMMLDRPHPRMLVEVIAL